MPLPIITDIIHFQNKSLVTGRIENEAALFVFIQVFHFYEDKILFSSGRTHEKLYFHY